VTASLWPDKNSLHLAVPDESPQPHEQLLMGWIMGGTTTMTVKGQQGGTMKGGGQERATRRENEGNECKARPKQHVVWAPGMLFFLPFFALPTNDMFSFFRV
jgi:hypothetical protein